MKLKLRLGIIAIVLAISACATNLIGKETQALQAVTASRMAATASLRAGKITKEKDQAIQAQLDTVRAAIVAAVAANNPAEVDAQAAKADALNVEKAK